MVETYRHFFDIDPDFFPVVNEGLIESKPDLWKKFYPHETFIKLIRSTVSVLNRKNKNCIWVEGAYGTGKSHAVLTLKKLLEANEIDTRDYFKKYNLDNDLFNTLQQIKSDGKILTVHRYGSSNISDDNDLVFAVQESIEHSLKENGLENNAEESLKSAIIRYLSDPENKQSINVYLKGSYSNLFGGDDADKIIEKLETYSNSHLSNESLHNLMHKIFKLGKEKNIRLFSMTTNDLAGWIKNVIKQNQLKAIVFIWDEFTEYFKKNKNNFTGFQGLCEICNTDPFYFILVTHVSSGLFYEKDEDYKKLNDRFLKPHSTISLPENIAFQLMGAAMEKNKDESVEREWNDIAEDLSARTKDARKLLEDCAHIDDKELKNIIPIHPYTALLLKHISSAFESNQRSMFDFIKNSDKEQRKNFQWFIDNFGPEDDNPLLTIDMLWDFFYEKGRDSLAHDVRSVLDYYSRSGNQRLENDDKRILKSVLLLQAISQHVADTVELFIPNEKNIDNAYKGSDLEDKASRIADKLVRDKILFKKQLGSDKFQYNAYINEASEEELEKYKKQIMDKSTTSLITEELKDNTTVADVIKLDGALKLRYELKYASQIDFDTVSRGLRNKDDDSNKISAIVCFAKDDHESYIIGQKIKEKLKDRSYDIVFIDASITPFGDDGYMQYIDAMAQSMYQLGKDKSLSIQYANNAKDYLNKWKNRINSGEFVIYTNTKQTGERVSSIDSLYDALKEIDKEKFPCCLESCYSVTNTLFMSNSLNLGVECGATETTRQLYASSNPSTKLENALTSAWKTPKYWEKFPNLPISKIKNHVDELIQKRIENGSGRVSIREIYDSLKIAPFGFMPCNLSAFILGFVLKEYLNGPYSWSDDITSAPLDVDKLKEMIGEVIKLQTTQTRYREKYIVAMTENEKAFNETTSSAFNIPLNSCTSVENTRDYIRKKMKEFSFPIWTLKYKIGQILGLKTEVNVLSNLIDLFVGIANNNNIVKSAGRSDNDIAREIGDLCIKNPNAAIDLKSLLTKENCTSGMENYIKDFDNDELISLSQEIGDNGQYINVLRKKFDADAANWVWNKDTADQKIREVILEYKIIAQSNKLISKTICFEDTIDEWCTKCDYIHISYQAAKNVFNEFGPIFEMLYSIKKAGLILDSRKEDFLNCLVLYGDKFKTFYSNQIPIFKRVCDFYLSEFSDDEIEQLYNKIPSGIFTCEKSDYLNLVESKIKEYKATEGSHRLKDLWQDRTGTMSPRTWSKKHAMPILCLIPDDEMEKAGNAFDTINRNYSDSKSIENAIDYLETASFFDFLDDEEYLDDAFRTSIIKNYDVMLTDINEVKDYLTKRLSADPYDWLGLPEVDKKLKQMAEAKYNQNGFTKALEKIDYMDDSSLKRYLKNLVKENMIVGMEILKEN